MLCALALSYPEEAIGIALAAGYAQMPLAIGFTLQADGHLPGGLALRDVIEQVDAQTDGYPLYYLIDCAHPSHAQQALLSDCGSWQERIRGLRVRASIHRHADARQGTAPDSNDSAELASHYLQLHQQLNHLNIFGGESGHHLVELAKTLRDRPQNL